MIEKLFGWRLKFDWKKFFPIFEILYMKCCKVEAKKKIFPLPSNDSHMLRDEGGKTQKKKIEQLNILHVVV